MIIKLIALTKYSFFKLSFLFIHIELGKKNGLNCCLSLTGILPMFLTNFVKIVLVLTVKDQTRSKQFGRSLRLHLRLG